MKTVFISNLNHSQVVWSKIFDRDDRYNLAKISYIPYLLSNNINTELVLERPLFEHQFIDRVNKEVRVTIVKSKMKSETSLGGR